MIQFLLFLMMLMQGMHSSTLNTRNETAQKVSKDDQYSEFALWTADVSLLHPFFLYLLYRFFRTSYDSHHEPSVDEATDVTQHYLTMGYGRLPDELKDNILQYLGDMDAISQICYNHRGCISYLLYDSFTDSQSNITAFIRNETALSLDEGIIMEKSRENKDFSEFVASWIDEGRIKVSENILYLSVKYQRQKVFESAYHKLVWISKNMTKKILNLAWETDQTTMFSMVLEKYVNYLRFKLELLKEAFDSESYKLISQYLKHLNFPGQERQKLRELIASSSLGIFLYIRSHTSVNLGSMRFIYDYALDQSNFEIADHLCQEGIRPRERNLLIACRKGNLETVEYLTKKNMRATNNALRQAVISGNLELVKYLVECRKVKPKVYALELSCLHGNVPIYDYIIETLAYGLSKSCLDAAAVGGNFHLVEKLLRTDISDPATRQRMLSEGKIVQPDALTMGLLHELAYKGPRPRFRRPGREREYRKIKNLFDIFAKVKKIGHVEAHGERIARTARILKLINT